MPLTLRRERTLVVMMLVAASASADTTKAECASAYERGQILRRKGELVRASEQLLTCAREACPAFLRKDCAAWHAELQAAIPSIVVVARTKDGVDVADVRVSVDGHVVAEKLEGRGISLDPGAHTLRFERQATAAIERSIVLIEGQKLREVVVEFDEKRGSPEPVREPPPTSSSPESPPPRADPSGWIVAGIGVLALGTFITFGALGRSDQTDHLERCNPRCSPDEIGSVRGKYIVADVALGVAVVSFAVSAFLFVTRSRPNPSRSSAPP